LRNVTSRYDSLINLAGLVGGYDHETLSLIVWFNDNFPILPPKPGLDHPATRRHVRPEGLSPFEHTAKINLCETAIFHSLKKMRA
jgi:hypothetical protein